MREPADRSADLADRDRFARPLKTFTGRSIRRTEREYKTEGGRLAGLHACRRSVRPLDYRSAAL